MFLEQTFNLLFTAERERERKQERETKRRGCNRKGGSGREEVVRMSGVKERRYYVFIYFILYAPHNKDKYIHIFFIKETFFMQEGEGPRVCVCVGGEWGGGL